MVEDRTHLRICDAGKPLQELGGLRSVLQVLEQRGNRYSGATKYPITAHTLGVTLKR